MLAVSDENIFRLQDFTSATPLEQLAKKISRCLLSWNKNALFCFSETFPKHSETLSITEESIVDGNLEYHLSFFLASEKNCEDHSFQFYAGKVHPLQRWFGLSLALIISIPLRSTPLCLSEAKSLLDALTLGCQESRLHLPCFVLVDTQRSHYIGQWITKGTATQPLKVYQYESVDGKTPHLSSLPSLPSLLKDGQSLSGNTVLQRLDFFNFFCRTIGIDCDIKPKSCSSKSPNATFYTGFRYVFYVDQFAPILNSFWINRDSTNHSKSPDSSSLVHEAQNNLLDPITQFHLICTWEPKEISLQHPSQSPDAWNPSECVWSLRVVGSRERPLEEINTILVATTTFKTLLSYLYVSSEQSHNESPPSPPPSPQQQQIVFNQEPPDETATTTTSYLTTLKLVTSHVTERIPSMLSTFLLNHHENLESRLEGLLDYVLDLTITKEDKNNLLYDLTNSFVFRLTRAFEKLEEKSLIFIFWKYLVAKIRESWEEKTLIPNVTSCTPYAAVGLPDSTDPPLLQKLKIINCCIQQHNVLDALKSNTFQPLIYPVFPPINFEKNRLRTRSYSTDPVALVKILVHYFILTHLNVSEKPLCEASSSFLLWLSELTDIDKFSHYCYQDTDHLKPNTHEGLFTKEFIVEIYKKESSHKVSGEELHDMYHSLFNMDIEAEMTLDYLTYLPEKEIIHHVLYCFIFLMNQRWKIVQEPSHYVQQLWIQWMESLQEWIRIDGLVDSFSSSLGWEFINNLETSKDTFDRTSYQSLKDNPGHVGDTTSLLQGNSFSRLTSALERFELNFLYQESLRQKFAPLPTLDILDDILVAMERNEETLLKDLRVKTTALSLFFVEQNEAPGLVNSFPLPLYPMNMEYIFSYHPEPSSSCKDTHQPHSSRIQERFAYLSQMANDLRLALTYRVL